MVNDCTIRLDHTLLPFECMLSAINTHDKYVLARLRQFLQSTCGKMLNLAIFSGNHAFTTMYVVCHPVTMQSQLEYYSLFWFPLRCIVLK